MRTNLIDSLTENVVYNEKRQKDSIKFFEISDVYTSNNKKLKTEKRLAIIVSGRGGENYINFSQILNDKYLIDLFSPLGIDFSEEVFQINRDRLDSKIKTPIFGVEISLETIKANKINYIVPEKQNNYFVQYEPISEFPSSYRDISFSINDSSKINEVTKKLEAANVRYLKKSFMFDFYKNNKKNETKIGYRFIFQSFNKTLTDQDINISIEEILKEILLIDSVSIPGR
jgi:phenylalanyl-tRNA synthetase beta subunit